MADGCLKSSEKTKTIGRSNPYFSIDDPLQAPNASACFQRIRLSTLPHGKKTKMAIGFID
jgi:hypothetical protein